VFRKLHKRQEDTFLFEFEGKQISANRGESVAAALLLAGIASMRRTPRNRTLRGPYCMMGACFECLVTIDGAPDRQACLVEARGGMIVRRQEGAGDPRQ
jgi:hypothetical protein